MTRVKNIPAKSETVAALLGGFGTIHAIRLGIEPFAELGANSGLLSGSRVDSPCSCRVILKSAPVIVLHSPNINDSRPLFWSRRSSRQPSKSLELLTKSPPASVSFWVTWLRATLIC